MDLSPTSLVLAVSTAWTTLFLGSLPTRAFRLQSRAILQAAGAWVLVAATCPTAVRHWYLIFAFICLAAWWKMRRDRILAGKTWLTVVAGLAVSLGVVFFLQAAPELCPDDLAARSYLLLLASIYLGGAVTGLACVSCLLARGSDPLASLYVKVLPLAAVLWCAAVLEELRMSPRAPRLLFQPHALVQPQTLLFPMGLLVLLSLVTFFVIRVSARASWLLAIVAMLALGAQIFARWLIL